MRLRKVMLHGSLTNMEKEACVWENLEFAVMKRGINALMPCGGKLLSRVMNMLHCLLETHITMVGYVSLHLLAVA